MTSLIKAWLLDPLALLFLFSLFLSILMFAGRSKRRRSGRSSRRGWWVGLCLWTIVFLVCSAPVIVNPLIAAMEDPYLSAPECGPGSHWIVLGGGVDSRVSDVEEFGRMGNATLTRATEAAYRILSAPDTRVIVAGGAVGKVAEADVMAAYMQRLGVEPGRIVRETDSSTTRENAVNVARLLDEEVVAGPVRLVSSAMHMPRALLSFRQTLEASGIEVCPVSVDVQALKNVPWYALMPQTTAIVRFEMLLHEAVALLVYKVKGWI